MRVVKCKKGMSFIGRIEKEHISLNPVLLSIESEFNIDSRML